MGEVNRRDILKYGSLAAVMGIFSLFLAPKAVAKEVVIKGVDIVHDCQFNAPVNIYTNKPLAITRCYFKGAFRWPWQNQVAMLTTNSERRW